MKIIVLVLYFLGQKVALKYDMCRSEITVVRSVKKFRFKGAVSVIF